MGSGEGVGVAVGMITGSKELGLAGVGSIPSQAHPVPIKTGTSNRATHLKQR
jgi:hypothetical protein